MPSDKPVDEVWHIDRGEICLEDGKPIFASYENDEHDDARRALAADAPRLQREVGRLRGLIREAELRGTKYDNTAVCPWCDGGEPYHGDKYQHATHKDDCPVRDIVLLNSK